MTDLGRRAQNASSEYAAAAAGSLARVNKMLDAMVHAFVDSNNVSISTVYRLIDPDGHANHDHSNLRVPATELGGRFRKLLADAMRREAPTGAEYLGKDVSDSALFAEADVRPVWLRSVREGEPTPQPALDRWVVGESFYGPLVELQPTKVAGTIEVDEEVSP
jgi:hypothetical protein